MTQPIYDDLELRACMELMTPWGPLELPQDVAQCAVILASDDEPYATGVPLLIDGGFMAA